jgi:hypothetical protein
MAQLYELAAMTPILDDWSHDVYLFRPTKAALEKTSDHGNGKTIQERRKAPKIRSGHGGFLRGDGCDPVFRDYVEGFSANRLNASFY